MNTEIKIRQLNIRDLNTVVEMAIENYLKEKASANGLSERANERYFRTELKRLMSKGTGRMAFENDLPIGFLAFGEMSQVRPGVKAATSPLWGYGIRHDKRGEIIGRLFQDAATELCRNYAQSLRVLVYAHDTEVLWTYLMSSFAMDMTGVVRETALPIETDVPGSYVLKEVSKDELVFHKSEIIELYRGLINHLRVSPVFYHCREYLPVENRFQDFLDDTMRVFALFDGDRLIGMVDAEPVNYGFAAGDSEALSLGDIFIAPEYRESGLAATLLKYANDELKKDGIKRLFVTHGTINPTARGFWDKYFTNYSYMMTRRIDSDMLGDIKPV
ncbi:MAG: GNAT family N-acetyltransferase [Dehalococcoidales bacterium]|nr:GNAT family N-acetyltransferase [Dehalococcoidales bacterium]